MIADCINRLGLAVSPLYNASEYIKASKKRIRKLVDVAEYLKPLRLNQY